MKNLFILAFFLTAVNFSTLLAQKGTLKGNVINNTTKETIIGAKIILIGTAYRASSDIDGNFKIQEIPAGDYTIEVIYAMYLNFTAQVKIIAQEETVFNLEMEERVSEFGPVVVTAAKKTSTEKAVMMEIKEAKSVVSGISKEQMSRSTDRTAAEAMQRIPGITIVDGRFALIRGVSSRYNSVIINNVIAPSTEIDRRTFSFDMIQSSSLDRMMVYKTASPEYPGDFAGGVIKLYTVSQIDKDFFNVKIETGYRAGTTFNPYMQSQGSKTDFLAFDNGFRNLPNNFPDRNIMVNESPTSEIRRDAARLLHNNYAPIESMAIPNIGLAVNFGKTYKLSGIKRLTTVNSINYSQSFQNFERKFYRYQIWSDFNQPIQDWFEYTDNVYQKDNKFNIMSNWSYTLSNRSKIKFSNLFNQVGENETIIRNGENFFVRPGEDQQNYLLGYKSRTVYSGQLEGDHKIGADEKNKLNWVVGSSYLGELEPDLRRFRRFKDQDSSTYIAQFSPSSNLFDNSRYYGELQEFSVSHGMNYIHDITKKDTGSDKKTISAGYYGDFRSRKFASRYFSSTYPGFFSPTVIQELSVLPIDEIFAQENYETLNGFILQEGTRPIDAYAANNILAAGYLATDLTFGRMNVSGGLRAEYNIQNMESRDDFGPILVNNPILSLLPSTNLSYALNEKSLIRAGYGRTVNRPEFRELAPFLFYDYKLESSRVGNPELKTASIDNIDLRYESYPRAGETFSIGGFYKIFTNPIEDRLILTTEQSSLTFVNADFAYAYGAEIEFKKSFKGITKSKFIDKFSVNMNASYIVSRVDLGETATAQDRVRSLQGQAPYIVNAALYYFNAPKKMNINVIYNIYGRNIFAVGDVSFPTMYELERHSLDVTFGKGFVSGVAVKVSIQNILDFPYRFFQDSNRNGKIDDADDVIISFRRGSLFTLSVTYDLLRDKK